MRQRRIPWRNVWTVSQGWKSRILWCGRKKYCYCRPLWEQNYFGLYIRGHTEKSRVQNTNHRHSQQCCNIWESRAKSRRDTQNRPKRVQRDVASLFEWRDDSGVLHLYWFLDAWNHAKFGWDLQKNWNDLCWADRRQGRSRWNHAVWGRANPGTV